MKKSKEFNDLYIMIVYDFIGKLEKKLIDKIIYNEGLLDLFNEMFANLRANKKKELISNLDDKSYLKWLLRQNLSHQN